MFSRRQKHPGQKNENRLCYFFAPDVSAGNLLRSRNTDELLEIEEAVSHVTPHHWAGQHAIRGDLVQRRHLEDKSHEPISFLDLGLTPQRRTKHGVDTGCHGIVFSLHEAPAPYVRL